MEKMSKSKIFFKYYLPSAITVVFLLMKYLILLIPSTTTFRLYVLSTVWFGLFAWIFVVWKMSIIKEKNEIYKHDELSALIIVLCYVVFLFDGVSFNIV